MNIIKPKNLKVGWTYRDISNSKYEAVKLKFVKKEKNISGSNTYYFKLVSKYNVYITINEKGNQNDGLIPFSYPQFYHRIKH